MSNTTSVTLLQRLRSPDDHDAWSRFARLYTPLMFYWCCRAGLHEQDAADLVQEVFVILVQKLPEFQYDRQLSFRNWLRVVTLNKWRERQRRMANQPAIVMCEIDQLTEQSEEWIPEEVEYRQQLVNRALTVIEPEFSPLAWRAFQQHVVVGKEAADVAAELDVRLGTVYAAKCRVMNRLRQELQGFLED